MSITAMKTALSALEEAIDDVQNCRGELLHGAGYARYDRKIKAYDEHLEKHESAITALRTAIAEAEKQEPIGYASPDNFMALTKTKLYSDYVPVYREAGAQPAKPLTDEQIEQCMEQAYATVQGRQLEHAFARAIEAKLKEQP